ncbi:MAG: HDOD domain-containing protein [Candidatus Dadabacteria bacterium]|nr:MAG: HDOD domain-containing protein [Candidatus Dadabacteria bacterium]
MPHSSTAGQQAAGGLYNRNLMRACKKVKSAWFPANPELLTRVVSGLHEGVYDLDIDFLIDELKTDCALFLYCLKELLQLIEERRLRVAPFGTPVELFRSAGTEAFREILPKKATAISSYSFQDGTRLQLLRLQQSMISASTAEVLAEHSLLDPDLSYSAALLRQLGLTLIAWNYPSLFERTLESLTEKRSLDSELTRQLGFSPVLLAVTIAREWGLSAELCAAMGDREATEEFRGQQAREISETAEHLAKICEIGEALARASNPEHYPSAREDWKTAKEEIEQIAGETGIKKIREKLKVHCENYISSAPDIFSKLKNFEPESHLNRQKSSILYRDNRYVHLCPADIQEMFRTLYSSMTPDKIRRENIAYIAKEIIPALGFRRGCIYLLDPENITLVPRLQIGESSLKDFSTLDGRMTASANNPVIAAYRCRTPIMENGDPENPFSFSYIAGVLGEIQKSGVIYLEFPAALATDSRRDQLAYFKAASKALHDALNLD